MARSISSLTTSLALVVALAGPWACDKDFGRNAEEDDSGSRTTFSKGFNTTAEFQAGELVGVNADTPNKVQGANIGQRYDTPFLWVTNSDKSDAEGDGGTISKIDTKNFEVIGEYSLTKPGGEPCYNPSRSTVDIDNNAWVGCRGSNSYINEDAIGQAPRPATTPEGKDFLGTMVPKNVDNKVVKVSAETGEVLLSIKVGYAPRALALDREGNLWVGCSVSDEIWKLNGETGAILIGDGGSERATPLGPDDGVEDFPYGMAIDQRGHLWVVHNRIPTSQETDLLSEWIATPPPSNVERSSSVKSGDFVNIHGPYGRSYAEEGNDPGECSALYGIAIDYRNDIWLSGWVCHDVIKVKGVTGYYKPHDRDYEAGTMLGHAKSGGREVRGLAVDTDNGVWAANSAGDSATKFKGSTVEPETTIEVRAPGMLESEKATPTGVGIDAYGNAWVVNRGSNNVARINVRTHKVDFYEVGKGPYTYSDMLGTALKTITHPSDNTAYWRGVIDSHQKSPTWKNVRWTSMDPANTYLSVSLRCGPTREKLAKAKWGPTVRQAGPISCAPGTKGRFAQVEVRFHTGGTGSTPILDNVTVTWEGDPIKLTR